ncbi:MAG: hypothetical protein U9P63_00370 [Patescibacteria group bacterium]|nr:hypothetical protein [Patescibacteria group bacterium]
MIKSKTLSRRQADKTCQNCKAKFVIEPEDFEFYKKIGVPAPTFCQECRMVRRWSFRDGRMLYKRKIENFDKEVFSSIPPNSPFKVYHSDYWWSDKMDAMKYGREYNFSRPFFVQIKELMHEVGLPHMANIKIVNSPYCGNVSYLKNCYWVFNTGMSENCAYGIDVIKCRDSYDLIKTNNSELCYELFDCDKCYQVFFSNECKESSNIWFSKNLVDCHNCFGCVNLRHKKYHIFNKSHTKEEYLKKIKELGLGSCKNISELKEKAKKFWLGFPNKFMYGNKNVDVLGNYLNNCKNAKNCFLSRDLEDCSHCQMILFAPSKDCYDITIAGGELCYELSIGGGYKLKFCWLMPPKDLKNLDFGLFDLEYTVLALDSSNLFACVGLRHKKYCILNKQYTKEEYNKLVPKIKKHMNDMPYTDKKGRVYKYGEFFPIELSPFAYNETIANEYFPLTKEQALERGYNWYDKPKNEYKPTIKAKDLPDNIRDVDDTVLKEIIECDSKHCAGSGVFRIIPQELKFYKKMNLPLPRLCPDCRHRERIKQRNPLKLWKRKCMKCGKEIQTTYSPDRKEIVYCESCYNKEVG